MQTQQSEKQPEGKVTGTYVYCVMPSEDAGTTFGKPIDASSKVRTLSGDGLTAIVSDALQPQYDPSRANIGAHERVIREASERGTVLPMRFGMVAKDDGAVEQFLRDKHADLEHSLDEVEGRAELALKVTWDQNAILREILTENEQIRAARDALAGQPEDQTRDQRVELGRMVTDAINAKRRAETEHILRALRPKAIEVDEQRLVSDTMVLNAAFLVDREHLQEFDDAVSALGAEQQGRLSFKYVGPLPPYSFVKIVIPKES